MIKLKKSPVVLIIVFLMSISLYANKSSVEIVAPVTAVSGSEITIRINVTHSANSLMHHTAWAYIKVNGKEVGRWEYPFDSSDFSKEVKVRVTGQMEIEAMSNCNIHGSSGAKTMTIRIK